MQKIQLGYGAGSVKFDFDEQRFTVLALSRQQEAPLSDIQIGKALDTPIESPVLDDIFSTGESVLLVVSDATRATASAQVINLLVRRLVQIGIAPSDISVIFATGIHRAVTPAEKQELLTPFVFQRLKTLDHNAADPQQMVMMGTTEQGTPIELNRALREFSHVVITGAISFHYFAGFTGGRKSICPGLASSKTIAATHLLALDLENGGRPAGVGPGLLNGNAIHEECEAIAEVINPSFGVNCVVDEKGRAIRVYAGHWRAAHRIGCLEYISDYSVRIPNRRDLVIVSCGGSPYDINLIQAHKALDMAAYACRDGGTIILLAECAEGLGRQDFSKWFVEANSNVLESRLRAAYEVNGQTAWALLTKTERFRVVLVSSLPANLVEQMRMTPAGSLKEALGAVHPEAAGYIMPRGAGLLPIAEN